MEAFKATSIQASESFLGQTLIGIIAMTFGGVTYSWIMIPDRVLVLPTGDAIMVGLSSLAYILGTEYRIFDGRALIDVLGGPRIMSKNDIAAITVFVLVIGFLNRLPPTSAAVETIDTVEETVAANVTKVTTLVEDVKDVAADDDTEEYVGEVVSKPKRNSRRRR